MTVIANRVQAGIPAGGQFAPASHPEPALTLEQPAPEFDRDFEITRGRELAKALDALPYVPIREVIAAARTTDLLRDSYPDYWENGLAPQTRADALRNLSDAFKHLPEAERESHLELIRFAVHTEMKHWTDKAYVLHPDNPYELLVDPADYEDEDAFLEEGHDENRTKWADLADRAAFHAIAADNAASAAMAGAR